MIKFRIINLLFALKLCFFSVMISEPFHYLYITIDCFTKNIISKHRLQTSLLSDASLQLVEEVVRRKSRLGEAVNNRFVHDDQPYIINCFFLNSNFYGVFFIKKYTMISQVGSIAHEIAHSIGFYHEHSRPDRDDHVTINTNNIQPGFEGDFRKIGARSIEDIEPYDVSSVMHYGPTVSVTPCHVILTNSSSQI